MEEQRQPERRDKARPVKVYLSPLERADIEIKAAATGLPVAVFLRRVGLGAAVPSILDHKAVLALLKVNADQGRLGGLLKLWISGRQTGAASSTEIRRLLLDIESAQKTLRGILDRL